MKSPRCCSASIVAAAFRSHLDCFPLQAHGLPVGLMDLFVHGTEDALPDAARVDSSPIVDAAALFMLQKEGEPLRVRACQWMQQQ